MSAEEKILIASDHAAFKLKEYLKNYLSEQHYQVIDLGTDSENSTDYAIYAHSLSKRVIEEGIKGILLCGTGIGMCMAANRHQGIRAALCHNVEFAKLSRQHNNSNVLVLAGRFTGEKEAKEILDTWLKTDFEGGRHQRRVQQIEL